MLFRSVSTAEMLAPEMRQARDAVKLGTAQRLLSELDVVNFWNSSSPNGPRRPSKEDKLRVLIFAEGR